VIGILRHLMRTADRARHDRVVGVLRQLRDRGVMPSDESVHEFEERLHSSANRWAGAWGRDTGRRPRVDVVGGVSELVHGTVLPENATAVGVVQGGHQPQR
jgi:hypothetical protein